MVLDAIQTGMGRLSTCLALVAAGFGRSMFYSLEVLEDTIQVQYDSALLSGIPYQQSFKATFLTRTPSGQCLIPGIFVGIGNSLYSAGPVSTWIAYCIMASLVYSMTVALGEMATLFPVAGGFTHYASRFCDEALGFVSIRSLSQLRLAER